MRVYGATLASAGNGNTQSTSGFFFAPTGQPYTQIAYTPPCQFGVDFGAR